MGDELTEVVAKRMALDVDLDWELIKDDWRKEYLRRAASVIDAAREYRKEKVADAGPPCPRCGSPTEIREHVEITQKMLSRPFHYARWYYCVNPKCQTTTIMPEEHKVWHR